MSRGAEFDVEVVTATYGDPATLDDADLLGVGRLRQRNLPAVVAAPAAAHEPVPRSDATAPPAPPEPPRRVRTLAGYPVGAVAPAARAGAAVLVALLVALVAFAGWVSGARFEAEQQAGFTAFARTRPLVIDGTAKADPWPRAAPVALLGLPKLGRSLAVFAGADRVTLTRGPGFDPTTTFPGEAGNTVIVGRHTSYGGPFGRLDELVADDQVILTTAAGTVAYHVVASEAMGRSDARLTAADDASRLTLVTDASFLPGNRRWVVQAEPVAGGIDRTIVQPVVKVPANVSASLIEIVAILAAGAALIVFVRPFVVIHAGRRASVALLASIFVTLGLPLVAQLALLLPRAF